MIEYIRIQRGGLLLGELKEKNEWTRRNTTTKIPEGKAKIISPRLALYKYEKGTSWSGARYHVIHIPTGFVIADVEYADVKHVKQTFEESNWTLENGNTFVLLYEKIQWRFTCLIRYDVIETLTES